MTIPAIGATVKITLVTENELEDLRWFHGKTGTFKGVGLILRGLAEVQVGKRFVLVDPARLS